MSWDFDRAKERVRKNAQANKPSNYSVVDLTRERDFNLLKPTEICRAKGAHVYADITNFHLAVDEAGDDKEEQKKLVRALSVLRRIQRQLADEADVGRIQMQSARFHGMCYRPYDAKDEDNESKRATCAVIFAITCQSYLSDVFNGVFSEVKNFRGAAGVDSGRFLIANIGYRGDRELICLGSPANIAAKAIGESGTITVTERVYKGLPACLKENFDESEPVAGVPTYQASGLRWGSHPELAKALGVTFDHEKWRLRTEEAKRNLPLSSMDVTGVAGPIDIERLSETSIKRTEAVPFYADLDGFTPYVQQSEADDDVKSLVHILHLIRAECQAVVESDYDSLVIQHQGDCALGMAYLPCGSDNGNPDRRRRKGLDIAIGIQSSMEHVLTGYLGTRALHFATGEDVGKTLITRLGVQGENEMVALGRAVDSAQKLQRKSGAQQIRISADIYDAINDDVIRDSFKKDGASYVSTGMTFPGLDALNEEQEEKAARSGTLGSKATGPAIISVMNSPSISRPYAPEV